MWKSIRFSAILKYYTSKEENTKHYEPKIKEKTKLYSTMHQTNEAREHSIPDVKLNSESWDAVFNASDVDEKVNIFTTILQP